MQKKFFFLIAWGQGTNALSLNALNPCCVCARVSKTKLFMLHLKQTHFEEVTFIKSQEGPRVYIVSQPKNEEKQHVHQCPSTSQ